MIINGLASDLKRRRKRSSLIISYFYRVLFNRMIFIEGFFFLPQVTTKVVKDGKGQQTCTQIRIQVQEPENDYTNASNS